MATQDPRQLARELLTAKWGTHEIRTPESGTLYTEALGRVMSDPDTAAWVMDEIAGLFLLVALGTDEVGDEDGLAATFHEIDEALAERESEEG